MGQAKNEMIREMERGYKYLSGNVCKECLIAEALTELHGEDCEVGDCDFCKNPDIFVTDARAIQKHIIECLMEDYVNIEDADAPYETREGGYQIDHDFASDIIRDELSGVVSEEFAESIAGAVGWVHWCERDWQILSPAQRLSHGWDEFCRVTQNQLRFLFGWSTSHEDPAHPDYTHPVHTLEGIGDLVDAIKLTRTIGKGCILYRVRVDEIDFFSADRDLGSPPQNKATANRMSPAGMPMLYLADNIETAISEAWNQNKAVKASIATYELTKDIKIVDFSRIPPGPSYWSHPSRQDRADFAFLSDLSIDLSKPIKHGTLGDIHYTPTQIVCEYLTKVRYGLPAIHDLPDGFLHGIGFSSSKTGALNYALNLYHPEDHKLGIVQSDYVKLVNVEHRNLLPTPFARVGA